MESENKRHSIILKILLTLSLIVNVTLCINLGIKSLNSPKDRIGVLKDDTKVFFRTGRVGEGGGEIIPVILPKGIVVRDASPRGFDHVGAFDPDRFRIIVTSDEGELVDYSVKLKGVNFSMYGAVAVHSKFNKYR